MNKNLRLFRWIVSALFFLIITLSLCPSISSALSGNLITSQLGPVLLKLSAGSDKIISAGFLLLVVVLLIMGRAYCSLICPLGFIQDIGIRTGKIVGIKYSWIIRSPLLAKTLRIGILIIIIVMLSAGSSFLAGLMEPFSIFSRTVFLVFRATEIVTLSLSGIFALSIILFSALLIFILSLRAGRFFCSWICPVGTILWGLSFLSLFRLKINRSHCNSCMKCLDYCKSGAIDQIPEKIDNALCVGCFNCLIRCEAGAIELGKISGTFHIKPGKVKRAKPLVIYEKKPTRRRFVKQIFSGIIVLSVPNFPAGGKDEKNGSGFLKEGLIFPPGSGDSDFFKRNCTGCMVCGQKCPAGIIHTSAILSTGSPLLPILDFKNGYCMEDCIECTIVCPTGALTRWSAEEKKTKKIASLELNTKKCLVNTYKLECNVCAEICPVEALKMIPGVPDSFPLPQVNREVCTGCGKCLYRCPAEERGKIFIFNTLS